MSLVSLVIVLVVIGFLLWLVQKYIPMEPTIKRIITVVVVIVVCLWLLRVFGLLSDINNIRVGG